MSDGRRRLTQKPSHPPVYTRMLGRKKEVYGASNAENGDEERGLVGKHKLLPSMISNQRRAMVKRPFPLALASSSSSSSSNAVEVLVSGTRLA